MSFFDRQGIPDSLIRNRTQVEGRHRSQEQWNRDDEGGNGEENGGSSMSDSSEDDGFEDDVQILRNYSLISIDTDRTFEMHALVQLAMRKWLEANELLESWKQQYVKNLSAAFPSGEYENWTSCQVLFPHAKSAITQRPRTKGSLNEWASLMYNAAWYALTKGNAADAIQLSRTSMELRKKIFGQEHMKTLSSMGMVGLAYDLGVRWKEAEELQVEVMERRKRVLGEEHPSTLSSMANLAFTWKAQSQDTKAVNLIQDCIRLRSRILGVDHPHTLSSSALLVEWQEPETISFVANNMTISKREPKRLDEVSDHATRSKSKRKRVLTSCGKSFVRDQSTCYLH